MLAVRRTVNRRRVNRGFKARPATVPAPVGGWNARDSLDQMKPEEAVSLVNFFPGFGKVSLRNGHESYATDLEGPVQTLAEFNAGSSRKFIAAAGNKIWDISSSGSGSSLATGFSNDKWQWAQFDDSGGGARMGLVNGADSPQIYNGSTVSSMTISGSGLTTTTLKGIHVHKSRSYFWDGVSQDFWYSAAGALGGALTKFPLGRVSGFGGNLIAMGTWTRDGGSGPDDLAVFFMSSGDVIIYAGDDPGDASAWSLVGIFSLGAPLSNRGVVKVGADLIVITKDGYVPMSKVLSSDRARGELALSDKIRGAVSEAVKDYSSNFGWEAIHYPGGNMALFNVPKSSTVFDQHVVNTQTGAWCKFTGWNGSCFGLYNDQLYFGGSSTVYLANTGTDDNGNPISADGQTAWNYLKNAQQQKRLTMARVLGKSTGTLPYSLAIGADFQDPEISVSTSTISETGGEWDTSEWDVTDWPAEKVITDAWGSAGAIGYNFSARLRVQSATQGFDWFATGYLYEPGGLI